MSAVTKFFFRNPALARTPWSIIQWWEARRPAYNLAVGTAGMLSLGTVLLVAGPPREEPFSVVMGGVVVYGILANLFFTLGPALDLFIHRKWGREFGAVGPTLFRYGFAFAVGVTLLPIPMVILGGLLHLLGL